MTTWVCPDCGYTNTESRCSDCGGVPPDYSRHVDILGLAGGFRSQVPTNVETADCLFQVYTNVEMSREEVHEVMTRWMDEDGNGDEETETETIQETIRNKPTSLDQLVNFFVKLIFWASMLVFGTVIVVFAFVFISAIFGVR